MTIAGLPAELAPPASAPLSASIELRGLTRSGGRTLSGREQRVFLGSGYWEVTYDWRLRTSAQVRAYRAMVARLRAGEDILLPILDRQRLGLGGALTGVVNGAIAQGATQISITGLPGALAAGHHFSFDHRLYRITEIVGQGLANVGVVVSISSDALWSDAAIWEDEQEFTAVAKFLPPARAPIGLGAVVEFNSMTLRCVLKDTDDGDTTLDLLRFGAPSLTFVEHI